MKTSKLFFGIILIVAVSLQVYSQPAFYKEAMNNYRSAINSFEKGNKDSLLYFIKKACNLRKSHPGLIFTRSAAYCLNEKYDSSINDLKFLASMGLSFNPEKDSDFVKIWENKKFKQTVKQFTKNIQPFGSGKKILQLDQTGRIIEGITYDKNEARYYLTCVNEPALISVDTLNTIIEYHLPDSLKYFSMLGLKADSITNKIYISAAVLPQSPITDRDKNGDSALLTFDLKTRQFQKLFGKKRDLHKYAFNDICLDTSGNVFITDSKFNTIFKYNIKLSSYEEIIEPGLFISLQGIDYDKGGNNLIAADYSLGIFKINLDSMQIRIFDPPAENTVLGIDGLTLYKNELICTQNGTQPHRVISIKLDDEKNNIDSVKVIDSNLPEYDEPTLGLLKGNKFIYIANSQWNKFDNDGNIIDTTKATIIMQTEID